MNRCYSSSRRARAGVVAASLAAVISSVVSVGPAEEAAAHRRASASTSAAAEFSQPTLRWPSSRSTVSVGTRTSSTISVLPGTALSDVRLRVTGSGPISILSGADNQISKVALSTGASRTISFLVRAAGTGAVHASLTARAANGSAVTAAVDLDYATGGNVVVFSGDGLLDAQLAALGTQRAGLGATEYARRLFALRTAGAYQQLSTAPSASSTPTPATPPVDTTVSGTISYLASDSSKHPARTITVKLVDSDGTATGTVLATKTTNASGAYSFTTTTLRSGTTPRKLFVKALAEGSGFTVKLNGILGPHSIASTPLAATGAAQRVSLTANNTADNNTAFDVADALTSAIAYTRLIHGGATYGQITASYPNAKGTDFDPTTGVARIIQFDRFDWDVILHEYGHFIAHKLGIDKSLGGRHQFTVNEGEVYGKQNGVWLAWSEGFATWFALTAQDVLGVSALKIPKAGDSYYDDTEDTTFHVPFNTNGVFPSIGEDAELSVGRALWHLRKDPVFAMSDTQIMTALAGASAATLSDAMPALMQSYGAALFTDTNTTSAAAETKANNFACLMTDQAVSPKLTAPSAGAILSATTPPTFTWTPNGAGPSNRLDSFAVQFWSPTWDKKIFESSSLTPTSYTPSAADWKSIVTATDGTAGVPLTLNVVVKGYNLNTPVTGPYKSCGVAVKVKPVITATPVEGFLTPISSATACAGLFPSDSNQFVLKGTRLLPNTTYAISLRLTGGGYPDVPLNSVLTDANGAVSTNETIPPMPASASWKVVAVAPLANGALTVVTGITITWHSCLALSTTHATNFNVNWGGAGLKPGSTVTESWNGIQADSTTADSAGSYSHIYAMVCPASSNTVTVNAVLIGGTSSITFSAVPCGLARSTIVAASSTVRRVAIVGSGSGTVVITSTK